MRLAMAIMGLWMANMALAIQGNSRPVFRQSERFPIGSYDERGFATWGGFEALTPAHQKGLALLRAKRYSDAWQHFDSVLVLDQRDLTSHRGRIEAARRLNKLPHLVGELNKLIGKGKVVTNGRMPTTNAPLELKLAYFYAFALNHYLVNWNLGGAPMNAQPDRRTYWMAAVARDLESTGSRAPLFVVMYATALDALGDYAVARRIMRGALTRWPDDYRMHLMLSVLCSKGTVYAKDSRGRYLTVPADRKERRDLALLHAERAIRQKPTYWLGYYFAGLSAVGQNNTKAREYLGTFVHRGERGSPSWEYAVWMLKNVLDKSNRPAR